MPTSGLSIKSETCSRGAESNREKAPSKKIRQEEVLAEMRASLAVLQQMAGGSAAASTREPGEPEPTAQSEAGEGEVGRTKGAGGFPFPPGEAPRRSIFLLRKPLGRCQGNMGGVRVRVLLAYGHGSWA